MRCTVSFHGPDLHLTEALPTELCLTTQRLLSNQAVGANASSVNLVVNQVMQFEHIHNTDGDFLFKHFTTTAIMQGHLATPRHFGTFQFTFNLIFMDTLKDWRSHGDTVGEATRQRQDV